MGLFNFVSCVSGGIAEPYWHLKHATPCQGLSHHLAEVEEVPEHPKGTSRQRGRVLTKTDQ